MMPVLSRAQARAFDAQATGARAVPGIVLMENAGRGATDVIVSELLGGRASASRITVVCGTGSNGGDGFVVARRLVTMGARVRAVLVGEKSKVAGDARVNLDAFIGIGGDVCEVALASDLQALRDRLESVHAIVDALFGTGLNRALAAPLVDVVHAMNAASAPRVALDVPSGLDADTGAALGAVVNAALTITFAHYKLGLLTPQGARCSGRLFVADIGLPADLSAIAPAAHLIERRDVARLLAERPIDAHKGSAGHLLAMAGSPGKIGAALMVAHGAMRAGAGLATIATWPDAAVAIESRVVEIMTSRLSPDDLPARIDQLLEGKGAVVIGPGFGLCDDARTAVAHVVAAAKVPVVIDADALTLYAGRPEAFASAHAAILTPHPGEMARLLETTIGLVEADRFAAARSLAHRAHATVVLKGAHTIVAAHDGRLVINSSGTPALATAGSGDVLSGIVGALACTLDPFDAACVGAYLHGLAGEAWSEKNGDRGLLASEIADQLPAVVAALAREHRAWPL